jgi:hypothetical protein
VAAIRNRTGESLTAAAKTEAQFTIANTDVNLKPDIYIPQEHQTIKNRIRCYLAGKPPLTSRISHHLSRVRLLAVAISSPDVSVSE